MINKRIHETSPFDKVFYPLNRNLTTFLYKLSICYVIPNLIFHFTAIKPIGHERLIPRYLQFVETSLTYDPIFLFFGILVTLVV